MAKKGLYFSLVTLQTMQSPEETINYESEYEDYSEDADKYKKYTRPTTKLMYFIIFSQWCSTARKAKIDFKKRKRSADCEAQKRIELINSLCERD